MFFLSGAFVYEMFWFYVLISLVSAIYAWKKLGVFPALLVLWIGVSAARTFLPDASVAYIKHPLWRMSLAESSATALILFLGLLTVAQSVRVRYGIYFFQFVGIVNAFALIIGHFFGLPNSIVLNASMSGCLNAVLLPLFFTGNRVPPLSLLIMVASILITKQSQPIVLLVVVTCMGLVQIRQYLAVLFTAITGTCVAYYLTGNGFVDDNGRIFLWKATLEMFQTNGNWWTGLGLGSYFYIGPFISLKGMGQGALSLHSDWLQILFELGSVGLCLSLLAFAQLLKKARVDSVLTISLLGYAVFGLANFPLHNPLTALYGAFLVAWTASETTPQALKERRKFHRNYQES